MNSYNPSIRSNSSNTTSKGTSLNGSSIDNGDGSGGSDVWYHSSDSSSFFLPFQRFLILNQARSSVKDPSAKLAVSLADSVVLNFLSSLKA